MIPDNLKMADIHWLGHASFMIEGEKTVYIDPYNISSHKKADVVLITHEHFDHCSMPDIQQVSGRDTTILITPDCQSKLRDFEGKVVLVEPDKSYDADGLKVETIRAYNKDKQFHPIQNDWVGYILTIDGQRIYHSGDTDLIPEMQDIRCDIAMLPVSGKYVMTAEEAAQAARTIGPKLAVPMHYGDVVGSRVDAERFKELCDVDVDILDKE